MKISDVFYLHQGNGFELYNMIESSDSDVNFISRTAQNNGVVATVGRDDDIEPFPAGYITVALGGSVLSSFVQIKPFYTAFHIMVLEPKKEMTLNQKLFYCMCIQNNAYRYSYGRQANKSLKDIEIPNEIPKYVQNYQIKPITTKINKNPNVLGMSDWTDFTLDSIFTIKYGINLELQALEITSESDPDSINFVARTSANNGVTACVKRIPELKPQEKGIITCAGGGSVLSTFVQFKEFYSGRDLYLLYPKFEMDIYSKLFCCTLIRENKYRYTYGRQANKTLPEIIVKLPTKKDGTPNFRIISNYMKRLPYSEKLV